MMLRRCPLLGLTTLTGLVAAALGASATTSTVRVGIADQSASMFTASLPGARPPEPNP